MQLLRCRYRTPRGLIRISCWSQERYKKLNLIIFFRDCHKVTHFSRVLWRKDRSVSYPLVKIPVELCRFTKISMTRLNKMIKIGSQLLAYLGVRFVHQMLIKIIKNNNKKSYCMFSSSHQYFINNGLHRKLNNAVFSCLHQQKWCLACIVTTARSFCMMSNHSQPFPFGCR